MFLLNQELFQDGAHSGFGYSIVPMSELDVVATAVLQEGFVGGGSGLDTRVPVPPRVGSTATPSTATPTSLCKWWWFIGMALVVLGLVVAVVVRCLRGL